MIKIDYLATFDWRTQSTLLQRAALSAPPTSIILIWLGLDFIPLLTPAFVTILEAMFPHSLRQITFVMYEVFTLDRVPL
jgi:hypothetical protein